MLTLLKERPVSAMEKAALGTLVSLKNHAVLLYATPDSLSRVHYYCLATDVDHANDKARLRYPNAKIVATTPA